MNRWVKRGLIAIPVLVALFFGAIFLYAKVLNDSPSALSEADLSEAVAGDETHDARRPRRQQRTVDAGHRGRRAAPTEATTAAAAEIGVRRHLERDPESEFGYRVEEVLFGVNTTAAGRSNQITGSMTIEGTTVTEASFTVDVGSITSDESRRDNQFRGRIMEVDQFPRPRSRSRAPIDFGAVPAAGSRSRRRRPATSRCTG